MLKTIVIDSNEKNITSTIALLKKNKNIDLIGNFNDFSQIAQIANELDLILFDINSNNKEEILNNIRNLKNKNINLIAISSEINSELINETLKENVKDFLLKPIIEPILEAAIKKLQVDDTNSKTICIFSNKGAIGKTSLAINLAHEISLKTNEKVCLLDLSFNSADVCNYLNIEPKSSFKNLLAEINNLNEITIDSYLNKYIDSNLYILADKEDFTPHNLHNAKDAIKIINSLKNIFSYIIIDTSSLFDETNANILNLSDIILMMCLNNQTSIKNCKKYCELFDKIGYSNDKIRIIINRYIENSEISAEDIEKILDKKVFEKIPNNYLTLTDAINCKKTLKETNPQSNICKSYDKLADKLLKIDFKSLEKNKNTNLDTFDLLKKMGEE